MSAHTFGAFIDIESGPKALADPPAVHQKPISSAPAIELDDYAQKIRSNGYDTNARNSETFASTQTPHTGGQTPIEPNANGLSSSEDDGAATLVQSFSNPSRNKWRVLCSCLIYFGTGMNDSAPGALIPYMETDYHIGYAVVSLIFVTNAVGFISAAFFNDFFVSKLGRGRTLMFVECLMIVSYIAIVCTPPFPVVVVAFLFLGYAMANMLAINNVFNANLANSSIILGASHGSYGIGGIVGPIVATTLVSHGITWSRYYLITLGIRVACFVFAGLAWRGYENEDPTKLLSALERTASQGEPSKRELFKKAVRNRTTYMGALFIFCYQGAEVSISGWVISFLITYRGGDPAKVGYVTAGFWGGITLGRFFLTPLGHRVGEKRFVYILTAASIAFQLLVWLVPNVIGEAVAVSILGLLQGPVYPCATAEFTKLLPRSVQLTSLSFIASAGSSGGALAPFTTGLLAQAVGTFVLHPVCIVLFAGMLGCWFALPKVNKRVE